MYGYNNALPITVTSATAGVMKETMMKYLECESTEEFNRVYRGLEKVKHGNYKIPTVLALLKQQALNPYQMMQILSSILLHRAITVVTTSAPKSDISRFETFDYDLQNAYPTAMCLVPDIDWENPIRSEVIRRDLTLADFTGIGGYQSHHPFVGYVRFEFPETVKYPCIPVNVDGIPPVSSHRKVWMACMLPDPCGLR